VSGTAGNPITYIGDVTGQNTDGVGGVVRITGSDNDTTAARSYAVISNGKDYRTFSGFLMDTCSAQVIVTYGNATDWIVTDCVLHNAAAQPLLNYILASGDANFSVKRCVFWHLYPRSTNVSCVRISASESVTNANVLVENCLCYGAEAGVRIEYVGGCTVKACTFTHSQYGVVIGTNPAAGQMNTIYNCIFTGLDYGISAPTSGATYLTENYNTFSGVSTARSNCNTGANSITYPALFMFSPVVYGMKLPQPSLGELSRWSQVSRRAGTAMATDDLYGITRPTTDSKKSWGAVQYQEAIRGTVTYSSSAASLKLDDAGEVQFMVPVTAESTVFSTYVYRGTAYAGTAPQMAIIQPGQAGTVWTDGGGSASWNQILGTITPAGTPGYVTVALRSLNSGTAGDYTVHFDTMTVS
jgi:hypothetical protein